MSVGCLIVRVVDVAQPRELRHDRLEEFKPLRVELGRQALDSRHISGRPREAAHESGFDRRVHAPDENRDLRGRLFGCETGEIPDRDDRIDLLPNEVACDRGQPFGIPVCVAELEMNVLAADVAQALQRLLDAVLCGSGPGRKRKESDAGDLLRLAGPVSAQVTRQRPASHRPPNSIILRILRPDFTASPPMRSSGCRPRRAARRRESHLAAIADISIERVSGQSRDLHGGARRRFVFEIRRVDRIHLGEVVEVFQEHGRGNNVRHRSFRLPRQRPSDSRASTWFVLRSNRRRTDWSWGRSLSARRGRGCSRP